MKVLDGEINGFKIDKFNQYGLEVGKTQGICPLCSHTRKPENRKLKCASYDWERGLGTCHNCDTSFQLHTYERRGEVTKFYEKPPRIEVVPVSTKVESWFKSRGISKKTLDDLMITEGVEWMPQTGKEENTIQFNYFIGDELVNVKYRDGRKNFKLYKGAEKVFYNIDATVGHDSVIIVEGEMDVCAIHESGFKSVVSVPNGATLNTNNLDYLDNCIDYFEDKEKIIIAVDTDEAGIALQTELVRRFGAEVSWVVDFGDCKDANEYLIKYGATSLSSILKTAKPVPLENVVTFNDIEDEVIEFVKNGFKRGYQIGLENFDNIFSTYTGQFITVTGIPSSGKSDFVDQMVVGYNKLYGWKTAFASPENAPTYLHAHKLMRKIWGNMPTVNDINTGKWTEVAETVNENFFFIDMEKYNLEEVSKVVSTQYFARSRKVNIPDIASKKEARALRALAQQTGKEYSFLFDREFTSGRIQFNTAQINKLMEVAGQDRYRLVEEVMADPRYAQMSDKKKLEVLNNVNDFYRSTIELDNRGMFRPHTVAVLDFIEEMYRNERQ